ncbi:HEAT repeat domain-containing protein [Archangium violaceum]|uniref:HEAT repeat domain-containing protein n=1 Tax=Archangium violaceum TaxID=83451 RepID=UPI001AF4CA60|nr:HEAT repeat domain-containing protein [Archangium violaceum]
MQRRTLMWLRVCCFTLLLGSSSQATTREGPAEAPPTRIRGLLAALDDPDPEIVVRALLRLSEKELAQPGVRERLGVFAREPRMRELLNAKDWRIQLATISSLSVLGMGLEQAHLSSLVDCSRNQYVCLESLEALREMGDAASALAPTVANLLRSDDKDICWAALEALGAMGSEAGAQAPLVARLLEDEDLRGAPSRRRSFAGSCSGWKPPRWWCV